MKTLTRCFSVLLALVLGLSVCCADLAEEESAYSKYVESYFTELLKLIPGGEKVDWEGFAKAFDEKVKKGEEITLEDCLPMEGWKYFGALMLVEENGEIVDQNVLPCSMDLTVKGNTIAAVHQLNKQEDDAAAKEVLALLKADLESELSLSYLKVYLDQFAEAGVSKDKIQMTMQFLNADGTVIEEAAYTYADLEAAVAKSLQSFYASLFSLVPNPEKIDWDAFTKEFEAKKDSGAKITLEDCLPKESWNLLNVLMRMDDYTSKIVAAEDLPFTVSVTVDGNHFMAVHQLKEKVGELTAAYLVAGIRTDYESLVALAGLKDMYDWFAYAGVDLSDVIMDVTYLDVDGAVLYQNGFTYADLVTNLLEAGVA